MTTSAVCTASGVSSFGRSAVMSMPTSRMASTTARLSWWAGSDPAERTAMRPAAWWVRKAAAIWERPALWTQTNNTVEWYRWSSGARFVLVGVGAEPAACSPQGDVDESDEDRHLEQRADHPGQRLPTGCAEGADGDGDGELEVVARRGERQRGGSGVAEADALAEQEACEPHEREVDKQRQRDPRDIEGIMRDGFALEGEEQHDRDQQPVERPRPDARDELLLVPGAALAFLTDPAGREPRDQRYAEEDEHVEGDLPDRDVQTLGVEAEPAGEGREVEPAEERERDDLEDRVDRTST